MALQMKKIAGETAKTAGSVREAVQDFLVPELREIKSDVSALRDELRLRADHLAQQDANMRDDLRSHVSTLREDMRSYIAGLREEMRVRDSSLREELRLRDESFSREVRVLSEKLDTALNIRERIIALEERLPRVQ